MATLVSTARIDADDVKEIIDTTLTDAQINAFINAANAIIQGNLTNKNLGATLLAEIEKWLAAHLLSMRDQRTHQESVGGEWSVKYQGQSGMHLDATTYGQQVQVLDYSGTLTKLGKIKRASIEVISEQDDYTRTYWDESID